MTGLPSEPGDGRKLLVATVAAVVIAAVIRVVDGNGDSPLRAVRQVALVIAPFVALAWGVFGIAWLGFEGAVRRVAIAIWIVVVAYGVLAAAGSQLSH